ncbi:MAG: trypsin-like serine protease [Planctomycetota bacterium]
MRPLLVLTTALPLVGCGTTPIAGDSAPAELPEMLTSFGDQTPAHVPDGALDAVVLIQTPDRSTYGSAIGVSERHLLTAAHVVDGWETDTGVVRLRVDGDLAEARIVARGSTTEPHGDWALLELPRRMWPKTAPVHTAARGAGWSPAVDTEVLLVGYASGFYVGDPARAEGEEPPVVLVDAPTPSVVMRMAEAREYSWALRGDPLDLGGMSGGAAMVWSHERARAELIAVFVGYSPARRIATTERTLGGVVLSRETETFPAVRFNVVKLPLAALESAGI